MSNVFWLPPSSPLLTTAPHHAHFGRRRKPYHWSNCVFMTTIRKIIDNHSRCHCHHHRSSQQQSRRTTSACKTQHTTTLSRDHNHNTKTWAAPPPPTISIKKWNFSDSAQKYCSHHYFSSREEYVAEERGRHNLGSRTTTLCVKNVLDRWPYHFCWQFLSTAAMLTGLAIWIYSQFCLALLAILKDFKPLCFAGHVVP